MTVLRFCLGICTFGFLLTPLHADSKLKPLPSKTVLNARELARRIDAHLQARWKEDGIKPAPVASDAELVRRLYLDLRGRIPMTSEVHVFLDETSPDKRWQLVSQLLNSSGYVNHFTDTWQDVLVPPTGDRLAATYAAQMSNWLKQHFRANTPYDKMVRELLTTPAMPYTAQRNAQQQQLDRNVIAFYQANQMKPENVASATSRIFLGVKLECAQCHDHPFAEWSQKQFWQFTAFFGGMKPNGRQGNRFVRGGDDPAIHEIKLADTDKVVQARFLNGKGPDWKAEQKNSREILAAWITSPDNPYFARATVNRLWDHFFGIGLVDPVDGMNADNQPSHPQLLEELADQFVRNGYDFKYVVQAITGSKAYQLTSIRTHESQDDVTAFARMNVKGLTSRQLVASLLTATGYRTNLTQQQLRQNAAFGRAGAMGAIQEKFTNSADKRTEYQTSILQALTLMNGELVKDATSLDKSETLAAITRSPFMSTEEQVEALYLAALSRKPSAKEKARLVKYVDQGGPSGKSSEALADVFWALLNSSEFILNH